MIPHNMTTTQFELEGYRVETLPHAAPELCGTGTLACASILLEEASTGRSAGATQEWVIP